MIVPRMVTDTVAGLIMYGDFIASGYVPADEQSTAGEKVYVQVTAPNLTSHKVRLTDEAVQQMYESESDLRMGSPIMLDVRPMVFRDAQYWRGESFHVRPDGRRPVWPAARPASDSSSASGTVTTSAASNAPNASGSGSGSTPKSGGGKS